jgi:hypothetical protein
MSSKALFRNWLRDSEEMNVHLPDIDPINIAPGRAYEQSVRPCKIVIVDFLVWLAGLNPEDGVTAGTMIERLRNSVLQLSERSEGQITVFAVDKGHVTIAKGGTHAKRRDQREGRSNASRIAQVELKLPEADRERNRFEQLSTTVRQNIPRNLTFQEAVAGGIISTKVSDPILNREQKRKESLEYHLKRVTDMAQQRLEFSQRLTFQHSDIPKKALDLRIVDVPGLTMLQRALLAVSDTELPRPWSDVMAGNRDALMRYILRSFMCASNGAHMCPKRKSAIIFDGHCLTSNQWPSATEEQLNCTPPCRKSGIDKFTQQQLDVPLMFLHPDDARESISSDGQMINISVDQNLGGSSSSTDIVPMEVTEIPYALSLSELERSTLKVADSPSVRPRAVVAPVNSLTNSVGEADLVVFYYALELMKMHAELPPVVEICSVDTDYLILGLMWLFKWQNNMFAPYFETENLPLPTLLHTSGRGWSTAGLKNGTMNVTAAYKRLIALRLEGDHMRIPSFIASIVSAGGDYTSVGYSGLTMIRFANAFFNYQTRHIPKEPYLANLVSFYWSVEEQRWLPRVSGCRFTRLIRCAFFDAYRKAIDDHYMEVTQPWHLTFDQIRLLINSHVTKSLDSAIVNDPTVVMVAADQHIKMMRALKKRIPPDTQLKVRALSLLHVMLMYNDVGLSSIRQYDLASLGYGREDSTKPMSRDNIASMVTDDWEGRKKAFFDVHGIDPDIPVHMVP